MDEKERERERKRERKRKTYASDNGLVHSVRGGVGRDADGESHNGEADDAGKLHFEPELSCLRDLLEKEQRSWIQIGPKKECVITARRKIEQGKQSCFWCVLLVVDGGKKKSSSPEVLTPFYIS